MIDAMKCRFKTANSLPRTYLKDIRILMKNVNRKIKDAMRHGEFTTIYIFPYEYHEFAPFYLKEYFNALGYQTTFKEETRQFCIEW